MTLVPIYLHGFSSSPSSAKARYFAKKLAAYGIELLAPDLNTPSFTHLTMTAMVEKTRETVASVAPQSVILIGSSLGAAVGINFMHRHMQAEAQQVERLLLLAPAFDFSGNRQRQLGPEGMQNWQKDGWWTVPHYGTGQPEAVHYGLFEDLQQYDPYAVALEVSTTIIHGEQDQAVDYRQSVRFAANNENVILHLVDADHSLTSQLDVLWKHLQRAMRLPPLT
ncbi:MAG: alpha/beta fold hydrolase [Anaerolineae bacterium]|nr:alpha/beta fold hydrolase [Anaerolineae bacterium]